LENLPKSINHLDISSNEIQNISSLVFFLKNNSEINFHRNPIVDPPLQIIKQGNEAIIRHFERLEKDKKGKLKKAKIFEAKLIFVGQGSAGKTTLARRIIDDQADLPDPNKRTRGIDIDPWYFDKQKKYLAHIWDFGGQDVYYPVHRFSLTESSVYVLLASSRNQDNEFNYWIPTIYQFGGNSPVIIGQTCHDGSQTNWTDIPIFFSKSQFNIISNSMTKDNYWCLNLPSENQGLKEIKEAIISQILNLNNFGKTVPHYWLEIREKLSTLKQATYILEKREYLKLYREIEKENNKNLDKNLLHTIQDIDDSLNFFHKLGVILHYNEIPELKDSIIIQTNWALDAVYLLIDDEKIKSQRGRIFKSDFNRLWINDNLLGSHVILKSMLRAFKIAFPLKHDKETYIIPALQKTMPFESKINEVNVESYMEYKFDFMPKGFINQLTSELSKFTQDEEIWNNAVNLYFDNDHSNICQVIEDNHDKILSFSYIGRNNIEFVAKIQDTVTEIKNDYKGIKYEINIKCPCHKCKSSENPNFFNYVKLKQKFSVKGTEAGFRCNDSDEDFKAIDLLYRTGFDYEIQKMKKDFEKKGFDRILNQIHQTVKSNNNLLMGLGYDLEKLKEINLATQELIEVASDEQLKEIKDFFVSAIVTAFEVHEENQQLKELYHKFKLADSLEAKLEIGIPLANILGLGIELKIDLKKLMNELKIPTYRLLGYL